MPLDLGYYGSKSVVMLELPHAESLTNFFVLNVLTLIRQYLVQVSAIVRAEVARELEKEIAISRP